MVLHQQIVPEYDLLNLINKVIIQNACVIILL